MIRDEREDPALAARILPMIPPPPLRSPTEAAGATATFLRRRGAAPASAFRSDAERTGVPLGWGRSALAPEVRKEKPSSKEGAVSASPWDSEASSSPSARTIQSTSSPSPGSSSSGAGDFFPPSFVVRDGAGSDFVGPNSPRPCRRRNSSETSRYLEERPRRPSSFRAAARSRCLFWSPRSFFEKADPTKPAYLAWTPAPSSPERRRCSR
mmetsp:Transcript_37422/g.87269  ORF Transcript_37422/g.87269 Transcript_37422/m.87269 type:complete len:210 (+) Transcript_37422:416-1045(+)